MSPKSAFLVIIDFGLLSCDCLASSVDLEAKWYLGILAGGQHRLDQGPV